MPQFFPHEKLEVYAHALSFAKLSVALIDSWPSIMAVCDQLDRATESIVTNLAKAARLRATENGIYCLECSLGSVLECAACLDVAYRRHLVASPPLQEAKQLLQRIARMEVGLRHSWGVCLKEEAETYGTDAKQYFLHESLVVYQRFLQVHDALHSLWGREHNRCRYARRVDELSTSLTINIAEGNGRFEQANRLRTEAAREPWCTY
ncbi:MAG: four helix bundle protein [Planctomycetota bacterium]|nr:four helix bundle protein [Planctomycetota bacterium]